MSLSIILPAYNERPTISKIISLVAAALPELTKEIVIVDDGSSDGTREWLEANVPNGQIGCTALSLDANDCLVFTGTDRNPPVACALV